MARGFSRGWTNRTRSACGSGCGAHMPSRPAQAAKPSAPAVPVAVISTPAAAEAAPPVVAEDDHGDQHADRIEGRRVDADRVQRQPIAEDLAEDRGPAPTPGRAHARCTAPAAAETGAAGQDRGAATTREG